MEVLGTYVYLIRGLFFHMYNPGSEQSNLIRSKMRILFIVISIFIISGCTTVKYNGTDAFVKEVNYPKVGKIITVYVGDHLVQKGTITEEDVLVVHKTIDGFSYGITAKKYPQIGHDEKRDFYSAVGVIKGPLSDPIQALALEKKKVQSSV
ncbi:MAG: hypothetical protein ACJA2Y_000847 [Cycloclasticus pugetii]|jgi:hypothetical protein